MSPITRNAISEILESEFERFELYLDTLETTIQRREKALEREIDLATTGMCEEYKSDYITSNYVEDIGHTVEALPRFMWNGAFVSLMSFFEYKLLSLTRRDLRVSKGYPVGFLSKNGRGKKVEKGEEVLKYRKDAEEYWEYQMIPLSGSDQWHEICQFVEIRNQIAHEAGLQDGSDRSIQVRDYIALRKSQGKDTLSFRKIMNDRYEELVLTADFCREATKKIRLFFNWMVASLP